MSEYPENKDQRKGPDKAGLIVEETLNELIVMMGMGVSAFFKELFRRPLGVIIFLIVLYIASYEIVSHAGHYYLLHSFSADIFTPKRLGWLNRFPKYQHIWVLFILGLMPLLFLAGIRLRFIRTKYQKLFESIGLKNQVGQTPILVTKLHDDEEDLTWKGTLESQWKFVKETAKSFGLNILRAVFNKAKEIFKKKIEPKKLRLVFDTKNIPLLEFENRKPALEAAFNKSIEQMALWKGRRLVCITFTTEELKDFVTFEDLLKRVALKENHFYIGQAVEGPITQDISKLPHMFIAGTTGGGKSVFFKQTLVGILNSTPHLQLYIIDLKQGLEAADFKDAPNVKIIKTISNAVALLRRVQREMKERFEYLESSGSKEIIPARDKKERIIVAVDESSVLHMKRDRNDDDYKVAMEARSLLDSLSKLSRAAAINLILATQKVDRETIPTTVQENISGRMAFKANTLQGSLVVLGNKDALELPDIPGRGIWKLGSKQIYIQAPFINEDKVQEHCKQIKKEFEAGTRKLFNPMLTESTPAATKVISKSSLKEELTNV